MSAQPQFILYRQGKNAIGPFPTIVGAAAHMGTKELLGYAIVPMVAVDYGLPKDSYTGEEILIHMGDTAVWETATPGMRVLVYKGNEFYRWNTRTKSEGFAAMEFMTIFAAQYPDIAQANGKINCIKALRSLFHCGLKEAKDAIYTYIPGSGAMHT